MTTGVETPLEVAALDTAGTRHLVDLVFRIREFGIVAALALPGWPVG